MKKTSKSHFHIEPCFRQLTKQLESDYETWKREWKLDPHPSSSTGLGQRHWEVEVRFGFVDGVESDFCPHFSQKSYFALNQLLTESLSPWKSVEERVETDFFCDPPSRESLIRSHLDPSILDGPEKPSFRYRRVFDRSTSATQEKEECLFREIGSNPASETLLLSCCWKKSLSQLDWFVYPTGSPPSSTATATATATEEKARKGTKGKKLTSLLHRPCSIRIASACEIPVSVSPDRDRPVLQVGRWRKKWRKSFVYESEEGFQFSYDLSMILVNEASGQDQSVEDLYQFNFELECLNADVIYESQGPDYLATSIMMKIQDLVPFFNFSKLATPSSSSLHSTDPDATVESGSPVHDDDHDDQPSSSQAEQKKPKKKTTAFSSNLFQQQ